MNKLAYKGYIIDCTFSKSTSRIVINGDADRFKKASSLSYQTNIDVRKSEYNNYYLNLVLKNISLISKKLYIEIKEPIENINIELRNCNICDLYINDVNKKSNPLVEVFSSSIYNMVLNISSGVMHKLGIENSSITQGKVINGNDFSQRVEIMSLNSNHSYNGMNLCNTNILNVDKNEVEKLKQFKFINEGMIVYKQFGLHYKTPANWIVKEDSIIQSYIDCDKNSECSFGINVASKDWILVNGTGYSNVWKCLIPTDYLPFIVVPNTDDGSRIKIRTPYLKLLEQYTMEEFRNTVIL